MKQVSNIINFSRYRLALLLAVIVVLGSCKKDNDVKQTVPFKTQFQLTSVVTQDGSAQVIVNTGTGDGTPIGKSSFMCNARIDATGFNDTEIITGSNGDQIFVTGKGAGPVIDFTTGNVLITYQCTITSGTGIYKGATGTWTTIGHANLNNPTGTDTMEGSITY